MLGALPAQVLRRVGGHQVAGRQGSARPDRRVLRDRGQGAVRARRRAPGAPGRDGASLLASFFDWAGKVVTKLSAKSALAEAFRYTLKRREALSRFLADGRLEADNNIAENAMRGIALRRKNYLFAGSDVGGERAAAMYTIMQTAKPTEVNPGLYLKDTLARIAEGHPISRIDELMPWRSSRNDDRPAAASP